MKPLVRRVQSSKAVLRHGCRTTEDPASDASAHRIGEAIAELPEIIRRSIGKFVVSLGPHVFGGIEFRSVGGEAVHEKSGMTGEESPDFATAMDRPAIPKQVDGTTEVPQ